jgi:hypothetical protein
MTAPAVEHVDDDGLRLAILDALDDALVALAADLAAALVVLFDVVVGQQETATPT